MLLHPWRLLGSLTHIELLGHDGGDMGETDHGAGTISLPPRGMTWAQRRSTLIHECLHILRGPSLDTLEEREELRVEESARWLLPDVRVIGEALAWSHSRAEAADELHVDERTLAIRLRYLHPSERGYLHERLEHL